MVLLSGVMPAAAGAQPRAALEAKLATATGLERAQTLAALTDELRQDDPRQAIAYGTEALSLFQQHPDPTNQIRTLNEMAWAHMTLSDYANAVSFAERGRDLAAQHRDDRGRARAINNLGVIAQRRGDALAAVDHFAESLAIYRALKSDLDISTSLNNLGFVHSTALADYDTALTYHVEALAVRERLGDQAAIALSLNNIGIIYHRVGELDRALDYYTRSLDIRRRLGGDNRISGTLNNIADLYFDKKDYERSLAYNTEALRLREKIGDRAGIATSLQRIGDIHAALGREPVARKYLNDSLAMAAKAGDRIVAAQSHLALAELDRQQGHARQAVNHAREALTIAEQAKNLELQRRSWRELADSQERAGDFAAALASLRNYQEVNERVFDDERTRRVAVLERRYQMERREAEIQQLRAQQATDTIALNQERYRRNAIIAGFVVLGLAGIAVYRRRVESARIAQRLSVTDALTGLRNRRYVQQTIEADTAISMRKIRVSNGIPYPVDADLVFMLIDLDHFKSVNDDFGHDAGDRVLAQVADVLRGATRTYDTVARWGGEEFMVICRFTNRDQASVSAERIRLAVERHVFDIGGGRTLARTCSIGYASFPFDRRQPAGRTWEQVVALADEALYVAKHSGRNAWVGVEANETRQEDPPQAETRGLRQAVADGFATIVASREVNVRDAPPPPRALADAVPNAGL